MKTLGLIAGHGEIPAVIAETARSKGYRVVLAALQSLAHESVEKYADESRWFNVGKVGAVIKYLKKNSVEGVLFAGKVPKTVLYAGGIRPDLKALGMLVRLRDRNDDSILQAINREFEKAGFKVLDMKGFIPELFTTEGKLTRKAPSKKQWMDVEFGFTVAKEIGRLGIGQTVVVKDRAVMAVEAIEGTDEAIKRGGRLAEGGAVVVKVSRPGQDMRYDVPVVGSDTLKSMIHREASVLALEAGKSILLNRKKFVKKADDAGIAVVGVTEKLLKS
jgi:DUF1009 family protein